MIRINLLPHREEKRKHNKNAFFALLAFAGVIGALIVLVVGGVIASKISTQNDRNTAFKVAITELDDKIKQIATLKEEIEALKARQQAVEDLQSDRNQPVYLMDELVKQTPEGVYLRSFKQDGQRVVISGFAQSNDRVSELLRNLSTVSPWLEQPQLGEIRATNYGQGKNLKRVFDFTLNVGVRRQRDKDAAALASAASAKVKAKAKAVGTTGDAEKPSAFSPNSSSKSAEPGKP